LHAVHSLCFYKGKNVPKNDHVTRLHALQKLSQLNLLQSHIFTQFSSFGCNVDIFAMEYKGYKEHS